MVRCGALLLVGLALSTPHAPARAGPAAGNATAEAPPLLIAVVITGLKRTLALVAPSQFSLVQPRACDDVRFFLHVGVPSGTREEAMAGVPLPPAGVESFEAFAPGDYTLRRAHGYAHAPMTNDSGFRQAYSSLGG